MRTGFGYDVHRMAEKRPLILGGVAIPFERGLDGHSDADVLLHAITDALLGAAALGDIGMHFPDSDERWRGADSLIFLRHAGALLREAGYVISNIDAALALQRPKIASYVPQMRQNIAAALGLGIERVSVKATTTEGLGFVGVGDGAAAYAVACIEERSA